MRIKLLSSIIIASLLTSHSGKAEDYQLSYTNADAPGTYAFYARSVFSNGISTFLKDIFSSPSYPAFLSTNFFHMVELLHHGNQTGKNKTYIKSVLRLFADKSKGTDHFNAYSVHEGLPQLLAELKPHFTLDCEHTLNSLKDMIYELQHQAFRLHFPEFKTNPELFLSNLSQDIEDAAELRKLMIVFLEVCLGKLIWSPEDQFETWQNVKGIADQLTLFYKSNLLTDQDDLNSLFITLLERYCFFLEIAGSYITVATFEKIRNDLAVCHTPLLDLEEQEDLIETKLQRFTRCLIELEAKARGREQGIVIR